MTKKIKNVNIDTDKTALLSLSVATFKAKVKLLKLIELQEQIEIDTKTLYNLVYMKESGQYINDNIMNMAIDNLNKSIAIAAANK